jgi:hypothetical protein
LYVSHFDGKDAADSLQNFQSEDNYQTYFHIQSLSINLVPGASAFDGQFTAKIILPSRSLANNILFTKGRNLKPSSKISLPKKLDWKCQIFGSCFFINCG